MIGFLDFLMGASAVLSIGSSIMEGEQAEKAADQNADIAAQDAQQARRRSAIEEQIMREEAARHIGSLVVTAGASNVHLSNAILADINRTIELDAALIREQGTYQASRYTMMSDYYTQQSKAAMPSALISGGASLLTQVSQSGWASDFGSSNLSPWD